MADERWCCRVDPAGSDGCVEAPVAPAGGVGVDDAAVFGDEGAYLGPSTGQTLAVGGGRGVADGGAGLAGELEDLAEDVGDALGAVEALEHSEGAAHLDLLGQQRLGGASRIARSVAVEAGGGYLDCLSVVVQWGRMIGFHVSASSAVPTYMQLVEQVRQALRLGRLEPGDRLPTVREVAAGVAVNPNTVLKAYRELEHEGLVEGRPGQGTYVVRSLSGPSPQTLDELRTSLESWVDKARAAGLEPEHIRAVVDSTINSLLEIIGDVGPDSAVETFRGPVEKVINGNSGAGAALAISLVIARFPRRRFESA